MINDILEFLFWYRVEIWKDQNEHKLMNSFIRRKNT